MGLCLNPRGLGPCPDPKGLGFGPKRVESGGDPKGLRDEGWGWGLGLCPDLRGSVEWGPKGVEGWVHAPKRVEGWVRAQGGWVHSCLDPKRIRGWARVRTQRGWCLGPLEFRPFGGLGIGSVSRLKGVRSSGELRGLGPCPDAIGLGFGSVAGPKGVRDGVVSGA
ncbi:hypothetical protein NC651_000236 [Populus alba x Populus x berolinensis]|nr:hypothetical protein NC651_000236 [Populus alba x Populus x berolinensis]